MRTSWLAAYLVILPALVLTLGLRAEPPAAKEGPSTNPIVQGNNQFALELFAKLREKEGNLFLSPYSISTALGMTYAGAAAPQPTRWRPLCTSTRTRRSCIRPSGRSSNRSTATASRAATS